MDLSEEKRGLVKVYEAGRVAINVRISPVIPAILLYNAFDT